MLCLLILGEDMRRREFISLLGGGAAAWPLAARAQQPTTPVVGFLNGQSLTTNKQEVAAFWIGMEEQGFTEPRNVKFEHRDAMGHYDQLAPLAADLVRLRVAVIVTTGGTLAAQAAKAATSTIPIVFETGGDPVTSGLVASLNRPGGNITGVTFFGVALAAKRMELLRELVPNAALIGLLVNDRNPDSRTQLKELEATARVLGQRIHVLNAASENDIDMAFETLARIHADALLVTAEAFYFLRREQLATLAAHHRIPAIYATRGYVLAGGLMSYAGSRSDAYRQIGSYAGRILKGAKPDELPVMQPTKFELVINLKAANALGLTIPPTLLVAADEVIE